MIRPRLQENQENPTAPTRFPTKTPLRAGQAPTYPATTKAGLRTTGKGLGVSTVGRATAGKVLGNKDKNLGKNGSVSLLFTAPVKAGGSSSSGSCAFQAAPVPAPILPAHLRTPSPAIHKLAALSLLSPGLDEEVLVEEVEQVEEMDLDREVEGAGESSRNYEEPFQPDYGVVLPDFKTAGYGRLLCAVPLSLGDQDWEARDEEERKEFKVDVEVVEDISYPEDETKASFPQPKRRALASKSTNHTSTLVKPATPLARKPFARAAVPTSRLGFTSTTLSTSKPAVKPKWGAPATVGTPRATGPLRPRSSIGAPSPVVSTIASRRVDKAESISLHRAEVQIEEQELGIFGIVENDADLLSMLGEGDAVEEFQFVV